MEFTRRRVRLTVAYDGTAYHGWQIQDNANSIEAELTRAVKQVTGEEAEIIGASRTDAGVHAYGNIAVFDTVSPIPPEKMCFALNKALPEDIRILRSDQVPPEWHPRRQTCRKTYEYRIRLGSIPVPTERLYAHYVHHPVDPSRMREAATFLTGEHDFAAFCAAGSQASTTVRTVFSIEICDAPGQVTIRVCGNGFLYNMVRILAGTLLDVGMGRKEPKDMTAILEGKDRRQAGPTLPAKGLFLMGYEYGEEAAAE